MRIFLVGAGGFAREVLDIIEALSADGTPREVAGIYADGGGDTDLLAARGYSLSGTVAQMPTPGPDDRYIVAFNDPSGREHIANSLRDTGWIAGSLVHPDATLGSRVSYQPGLVVCAGARVGTNVTIGPHVQLNANCTIGHDTRLDGYVSVNPLASIGGRSTVSQRAVIGTGANVIQRIEVGADAVVGAGAVVIRNVAAGTTVAGVPAYEIRAGDG